jgi:hypothetical protein
MPTQNAFSCHEALPDSPDLDAYVCPSPMHRHVSFSCLQGLRRAVILPPEAFLLDGGEDSRFPSLGVGRHMR